MRALAEWLLLHQSTTQQPPLLAAFKDIQALLLRKLETS